MTRFAILALFAGMAAGCGYDEDAFADDFATASCDHITSCEADIVTAYTDAGMDEATAQSTFDAASTAACAVVEAEEGETETDDSCEFDKTAAQDCVADIEAMSCDFYSTGTGYPETCSNICG